MGATLKQYTETSTAQHQTGNAEAAKALAQHLVADISWLSVDTTTSDTSTLFDQTLAISWDSNTKLRIYSSYSQYYAEVQYNGTMVESSAANCPYWGVSSVGLTYTTQIVYGSNFVFFGRATTSAENSSCFIGQVDNYYDTHKTTVYSCQLMASQDYMWKLSASGNTQYSMGSYMVDAFPAPYTNWGGAGHLYGAVPQAVKITYNSAAEPVIGFIGGTDSFYRMYDNGSRLSVPCFETFTINGHGFFTVFYPGGTGAVRGFRIS